MSGAEPHAWETGHGASYHLRRVGRAQGYDRGRGGRAGQARRGARIRKIANTPAALRRVVAKLTKGGNALRLCYEAGPCGYGIQRQLTAAGHECVVVAPSLIPRKPGDRIKTDRRDAINLAKLHRAGELKPIWVRTKPTRRCATWSVLARPAVRTRPAGSCPASCCAMGATITGPPGR